MNDVQRFAQRVSDERRERIDVDKPKAEKIERPLQRGPEGGMTNSSSGLKRVLSDSEDDDLDDEAVGGSSEMQQGRKSDRKRRRGVVEKRRRDRINQSLCELRRLVPAAFEKQGSAKLEKAEILQMTVDHLKMLHSKGLNGFGMHDPATLAMDYRIIGFRECAAEVARYLVSIEGMDLQDPLRMRLMSHLQCYSAQREAASKASFQSLPSSAWQPSSLNQYNSFGVFGSQGTSPCSSLPPAYPDPSRSSTGSHIPVTSSSSQMAAAHALSGLSQMQLPASSPLSPLSPGAYPAPTGGAAASKPYRPWGSELAY